MSIFDDIIKVDRSGKIFVNQWIEWDHFMIPNNPEWLRKILRHLLALLGHCLSCTSLDGCYLLSSNMPDNPLHKNCDCEIKPISFAKVKSNISAECDIRKFTEYVFKDVVGSKGKNQIFFDLGFSKNDSYFLQQEFCKQAEEQYLAGNYVLKQLDPRGQRMAIPITLSGHSFFSGWLLLPEGKIQNTTPFGRWIK